MKTTKRVILILAMVALLVGCFAFASSAADTYEKATSIEVGDTVILVCESAKMELSAISTTSTKYGLGVAYTSTPAGVMPLEVVAGSTAGTFAFKTSVGSYLYWSSGNSLNVNNTLSANTSWTVTFSNGNAVIKNAKDSARILQWNASSPRFACYGNSGQTPIQLYKLVTSGGTDEGGCEHEYEGVVTTPAGCESTGTMTYTCSLCGDSYTQDIQANGHAWDAGVVNPEPTCNETGTRTFTCGTCSETKTEEVAANGHNYVDGSCSVCGEEQPSGGTVTAAYTTGTTANMSGGNDAAMLGLDAKLFSVIAVKNGYTNSFAGLNKDGTLRLYAFSGNGSAIVISIEGYIISSIKITYSGDYSGATVYNSAGEITGNGDAYTVNDSTVTIQNCKTAQIRIKSIEITYCSANDEEHNCAENLTKTDGWDATCNADGQKAYWTCDVCFTKYSNADATGDAIDAPEVIPATGVHADGNADGLCDVCSRLTDTSAGNILNNAYALEEGKALAGGKYTLTGIITSVDTAYSEDFKNITVTIICNGFENMPMQCYRLTGDGVANLAVGNVITVTGTIKNYKGKIEFDSACTLDAVNKVVDFYSASVTLGSDFTMNYKVEDFGYDVEKLSVKFTMNGYEYVVDGKLEGNMIVFPFERIAPQCIGDTITAELMYNGVVIATKGNYSVKQNLANVLAQNSDLEELVTAVLEYGAAAQIYQNYKTDALLADISNIALNGTPVSDVNTPDTTYFASATVFFNNVNQIYVKVTLEDGQSVYVNGAKAELVQIGDYTYVVTEAITALEFDNVYTFVVKEGDTELATLTYSVNSYCAAKATTNETSIGKLAIALYNYGAAAEAYNK